MKFKTKTSTFSFIIAASSLLFSAYTSSNPHVSHLDDANHDGIRDPIDALINTSSNDKKAALTLYAIAMQNSLSVKTEREAALVNNKLITASRCILLTKNGRGDIYQSYEMGKIYTMTINSNEKQNLFMHFRSLCYDENQSVAMLVTDCGKLI